MGVDGQTAVEYAAHLEDNLRSLLDRAKSGDRYHAPPVRRVHIPKGDGKKSADTSYQPEPSTEPSHAPRDEFVDAAAGDAATRLAS